MNRDTAYQIIEKKQAYDINVIESTDNKFLVEYNAQPKVANLNVGVVHVHEDWNYDNKKDIIDMKIRTIHHGIITSNIQVELLMQRLDHRHILLAGKWNNKPMLVPSNILNSIVNILGRIIDGIG